MSITTLGAEQQMLTWPEVREMAASVNRGSLYFAGDSAALELPTGFNADLKEQSDEYVTPALLRLQGMDDIPLTKGALLRLSSTFGITREYMCKTPAHLLSSHMSYWLQESGLAFRLLTRDDVAPFTVGEAFTKSSTITPFSDVEMLDSIETALAASGWDMDQAAVDYKTTFGPDLSVVRVLDSRDRTVIESDRHSASNPDAWSKGISFTNSPSGRFPLASEGYLFAWLCTNGMVSMHAQASRFNRRGAEQLDAQEWLAGSIPSVLAELDHELESVRELVSLDLADGLSETVLDIFTSLKVPVSVRERVMADLVAMGDTSAYGVMQAVTAQANHADVSEEERARIMRAGGRMVAQFAQACQTCHRLPV